MNPDSENFDSLRRLLALKRHEQPPPGYFNRFSSQVVARVAAGEHTRPDSAFERWFGRGGWLQRLWDGLDAKPVFAGAFGAAVCALLVSGIVYSESAESPTIAAPGVAATIQPGVPLASASVPEAESQPLERLQTTSSTNPVPPSLNSLFQQAQFRAQPQMASFPVGN